MKNGRNVLPIALVLTVKRDGRYKCRAVALGNLYRPEDPSSIQVYASVISQAGSRYLLVDSAANGAHIEISDIENAFVQALIDTDVFVRLPASWRENSSDSGLRLLVTALYGLPQAPRLWAKEYEKYLLSIGWEQSSEKGLSLYRKRSTLFPGRWPRLSVYVDDNTMTAEIKMEVDLILSKFPGKIIPPVMKPGGWCVYDFLGADVWYRAETKELLICMASYLKKLESNYNMRGCKPVETPVLSEASFYDTDSPSIDFPVRQCIGALQWVCCVARPDIVTPVNCIARVTSKPATRAIANACKKILRYLISTPYIGCSYRYSPKNEQIFIEVFQKLKAEEQPVT